MISEFKQKVNKYVGIGLILTIGGVFLNKNIGLSDLLIFVGTVIYVYGLYFYAKAKGYTGWLAILGLFSFIGLLILVLLPDHAKQG